MNASSINAILARPRGQLVPGNADNVGIPLELVCPTLHVPGPVMGLGPAGGAAVDIREVPPYCSQA